MHITLTICSGVILAACIWVMQITTRAMETAIRSMQQAQNSSMSLRGERHRVTVLERELDALRRELRKVAGKFYASQRELIDANQDDDRDLRDVSAVREGGSGPESAYRSPVCENYAAAQRDGPGSDAAKCDCNYCKGRRAAKESFRASQARLGHLDPTWVKAHAGGQVDVGEN